MIIGFILSLLGTVTSVIFFATDTADFGTLGLSMLLWFVGVFLMIGWFKREGSEKLRFGLILAIIGQVTLWFFSEPIFGGSPLNSDSNYVILFVLICWLVSALVLFSDRISKYRHRARIDSSGQLMRQYFSDEDKEKILSRQRHRSAKCYNILSIVEFHHIDGNRSNNHISNCQALCPNCHAFETRSTKRIG